LKKASWVVKGVSLTHKYTDPTDVDITITNAGGYRMMCRSGQGV
jgi:hypothetical protein